MVFLYFNFKYKADDDTCIHFIISNQLFSDILLMDRSGYKSKTISYSSYSLKKTLEREEMFEKEILNL